MSVDEKKNNNNNHTATVENTFSKHNSSPQTLTSLLLLEGLFLKSPGTFLGLESCFMFSIQDKHFNRFENDQMKLLQMKQNWLVCELGTMLLDS